MWWVAFEENHQYCWVYGSKAGTGWVPSYPNCWRKAMSKECLNKLIVEDLINIPGESYAAKLKKPIPKSW
jgi:hypothetical protein